MYKLLFRDYLYYVILSAFMNTLLMLAIDAGNFDIGQLVVLYISSVMTAVIQLLLVNYFRKAPMLRQVVMIFILSMFVSFIILSIVFYALFSQRYSAEHILLLAAVSTPFQLSIIFFGKYYYFAGVVTEKERLIENYVTRQKEREIEMLKQQIDPHFIFNSFNTLSFLIGEDAERAKAFSDKLANVYRYIIFNSNKNLIGLTEELDFAKDYSYLQEIRHSNEVQVIFMNFTRMDNVLILPVSIQILIENAIKHNEFSEAFPLRIHVRLEGEYIIVENKKKLKQINMPISSRIGLHNLKERCEMIMRRELIVVNNPSTFVVQVPVYRH